MNKIRAIQALNKKEIENGITPEGSWHTDYRDTAFVYFGGLPYNLSEGDIITIFSQFGEPVFLKLVRDKETGKSKGFGWLKFEDQRSTDLAVDNIGGAEIGGRLISVDHARYEGRDDEDQDEFRVGWVDMMKREGKNVESEDGSQDERNEVKRREILPEERELKALMDAGDDDDPMKAYLIEEKKKEVEEAIRKAERREKKEERHRSHRSHKSHRSRRDASEERGHRSLRDRSRSTDDKDQRHRRGDRDRSKDRHRRRDGSADREKRSERRRGADEGDGGRERDSRRRRDRDEEDDSRDRRRRRDDEGDRERRKPGHSRSRSPRPQR